MRGCYRDYFFRDVNMTGFDFIGDMSFFDEELGRLEALLGVRGARATVGQNPAADYASMREVALTTGPVGDELAEILTDEVAFYRTLRSSVRSLCSAMERVSQRNSIMRPIAAISQSAMWPHRAPCASALPIFAIAPSDNSKPFSAMPSS
jgi:hypothetical protein